LFEVDWELGLGYWLAT